MTVQEFVVRRIDGTEQSLGEFDGRVLLIVNTASRCGFTPQYKGLQELYERYHDQGFEILGFPCNQFGGQEPGSNEEIAQFCETNYSVTFPMYEKIEVNGSGAHPLYQYLKKHAKGALGTEGIKWNFTKFLVDKRGNVVKRFAPNTAPAEIAGEIERELGQS